MKKATKLFLLLAMFGVLGTSVVWGQVTKIRDARSADGQEVTIEGIMNTPDYGFSNGQFFVQDSTGGINVFYDDVGGSQSQDTTAFTGWQEGDSLRITGTIGSFDEQIQIAPSSVEVLSSGHSANRVIISPSDLLLESELQGTLVKIEDVSLSAGETWPANAQSGSGVSVDVVSGDSTFTLRIDRDESFFDGAPAPNERFNLSGVLARFQNDVQIFPFAETDIQNIVTVSFNVNTATMPDTLTEEGYLAVFGGVSGPNGASSSYIGQTVDWNSSTDIVTNNIGGDYWTVSFDMAAGDELNYKYYAGSASDTPLINGNEQGWESGGNRTLSLPVAQSADTTVDLTYYETRDQAPFTSVTDSVTMFFRVNVGARVQDESFDPATDSVGIRGIPEVFRNPSDWSSTEIYLSEEPRTGGNADSDNIFYSGSVRVHKDSVANFQDEVPYKFVLETAGGDVFWDNVDGNTDGNRFTKVPAQDSTIHWAFFQETPPTDAKIINTNLNFSVNVGILEGLGFFNAGVGDSVKVRGTFNSWGQSDTEFNSFDGTYELNNVPLTAAVGSEVAYKYFILWDESRDDQASANFLPGITFDESGWEEPATTGGADRTIVIEDTDQQALQQQFYNGVPPEGLITDQNIEGGGGTIDVTFSIDMSNALTDGTPFDPANDSLYIVFDQPFFNLTQGFTNGDDAINQATDPAEIEDRRFTDPDGDGIWTLTLTLETPTLNVFGFRVGYGEPFSADGTIRFNGSGFDFGRRYYQYIDPIITNGQVSWPSSFTMAQLTWTAENLSVEDPPDYTGDNTSNEDQAEIADNFRLEQNYPNPFNPSTTINFTLPNAADVRLDVYNVLGQRVTSLINTKMASGTHSVRFDASGLASGMYIYRIQAGSFVQQRTMMLIK